jgi:hypothetical protein
MKWTTQVGPTLPQPPTRCDYENINVMVADQSTPNNSIQNEFPSEVPMETALQFLSDALAAFENAAQRSVHHEYYFCIAGQVVLLRIAGDILPAFLTPALMHRAIPAASPDLTICAFDTHSTGVAMPRPVWSNESYTIRDKLEGFANERILATYNLGYGTFNLLDTATGKAIYWIRDGNQHPQFEISSPLRVLFFWWMRTRGRQLVHGAAVGKADGGLLLVGKGGSGKSTSALTCLEQGWNYVGDDYVMFGLEPQPTAYNLYQSGKLYVSHLAQNFSTLNHSIHGYTTPDKAEKAILLLQDKFREQLVSDFPLKAVIFPRVTGVERPQLHEVSARTGLIGLVPSTVQQLPIVRQQDIKAMIALVHSLPNYVLELGGSVQEIPTVLTDLLSKLRN